VVIAEDNVRRPARFYWWPLVSFRSSGIGNPSADEVSVAANQDGVAFEVPRGKVIRAQSMASAEVAMMTDAEFAQLPRPNL